MELDGAVPCQDWCCTHIKTHRQKYAIWNQPPASSFLARHTRPCSVSVSHTFTPTTSARQKRKSTYDRCRTNPHRTSWCSRRWSPPTVGDTPPDGSMTPPYRWYWVLPMQPEKKVVFVSIFRWQTETIQLTSDGEGFGVKWRRVQISQPSWCCKRTVKKSNFLQTRSLITQPGGSVPAGCSSGRMVAPVNFVNWKIKTF